MALADIERLAAFYLGRLVADGKPTAAPLILDARHFTTHAVCVGMTGSGKTGLCAALLEEAALDGIPAIILDPKGDLTNLALSFPALAPGDYLPWLDEGEAQRQGLTLDGLAQQTAAAHKAGLEATLQPQDRVGRFHNAVEVAIYTPGSSAGIPLAMLKSLRAPPPDVLEDGERLGDHIRSTAAGLLALAGVSTDGATPREAVFLGQLLQHAAVHGEDLSLATLVGQILKPPFDTVGVLDLETFYPAKERSALAMALNAVLASPSFAAWTQGQPLDIGALLRTPQGRPRLCVLSLAHLDDAARMFFVTLLLTELLTWVRAQPGTSSLRALLFMDEVFGYLPPVANPPSKLPLLTLLKQARAFGLGVVLATQNPVDLDYKALANMGTWLLGRLQTERDKERLLDGLEGASNAGLPRADLDRLLSSLGKRQFLVHSVHEPRPVVMESRHTLCFLRGPLTRAQLKSLNVGQPGTVAAPAPPTTATAGGSRPVLPAGVVERFGDVPPGAVLTPHLYARVRVHFSDVKTNVDLWRTQHVLAALADVTQPFEHAQVSLDAPALLEAPPKGVVFAPLAPEAAREKSYAAWGKTCADMVLRTQALTLRTCPGFKVTQKAGQSEADFLALVDLARRQARDAAVDQLKGKLGKQLDTIRRQRQTLEDKLRNREAQAQAATVDTALTLGGSLLGALLGRGTLTQTNVRRAVKSVNAATRARGQHVNVELVKQELAALDERAAALDVELEQQAKALDGVLQGKSALDVREIKPRKADTVVEVLWLVWLPAQASG